MKLGCYRCIVFVLFFLFARTRTLAAHQEKTAPCRGKKENIKHEIIRLACCRESERVSDGSRERKRRFSLDTIIASAVISWKIHIYKRNTIGRRTLGFGRNSARVVRDNCYYLRANDNAQCAFAVSQPQRRHESRRSSAV